MAHFFRWPPDPEADEADSRMADFYLKKRREELWNECRPTLYEVERRDEALAAWGDWQTFGLPHAGGSSDQPYGWKRMVRFVEGARQEAEFERRKDEARARREEAPPGDGG